VRERFPAVAAAGRMAVVPNGIDLARFRPGAEAPDPFQVAWVGHVEPKKNPMLLLQVAHEVRRQDPRFRFHALGRQGTDFQRRVIASGSPIQRQQIR
jgi:glycosyltransferase involved in cell wall biosynthesis